MASSLLCGLFGLLVILTNHQQASSLALNDTLYVSSELTISVEPDIAKINPNYYIENELISDEVSDIRKQYATTELSKEKYHVEWTIKNYTLFNHKPAVCLKSPAFRTEDPNATWKIKFCLYDGKDARIFVRLNLFHNTDGSPQLKRTVYGTLTVAKSEEKLAVKKFDKVGESLDNIAQVYEYADEGVDLLTDSSPLDYVTISLDIDMPQKAITELKDQK